MHRFFAPGADRADVVVGLPDDEARHLTQVLRLGPGDAVRVFDGRGREHAAVVTDAGRAGVRVRTGCAVAAPAEPGVRVTLGAALLKGRKVDAVVRDATMLGVHVVQPLVTLRTEVPARRFGAAAAERWTRIAVASAKQCGRAFVPRVHPPLDFDRFLDAANAAAGLRLLLVEPAAAGGVASVRSLAGEPRPSAAVVAVGPEGGWTEVEVAQATRAGFRPTTLGRRALRAEAVPVAALAVLHFLWRDDDPPGAPSAVGTEG
ncbi:MAG: 16S rRNA (uracil(1498)-N(3))-methyltransferase [Acidobacteria bacterium]|nr:16S rRNA (uracil(1498)-N(3))-methyltransferase [Acidobacteriota bacterium]